jgi:hypothetical protein
MGFLVLENVKFLLWGEIALLIAIIISYCGVRWRFLRKEGPRDKPKLTGFLKPAIRPR